MHSYCPLIAQPRLTADTRIGCEALLKHTYRLQLSEPKLQCGRRYMRFVKASEFFSTVCLDFQHVDGVDVTGDSAIKDTRLHGFISLHHFGGTENHKKRDQGSLRKSTRHRNKHGRLYSECAPENPFCLSTTGGQNCSRQGGHNPWNLQPYCIE